VDNWVIVNPKLHLKNQRVSFNVRPTQGIVLQTVLPRSLGDYQRWPGVLSGQAALGYNFIHFAPIQELGRSQSHYSINDHLALSSELFPGLDTVTLTQEAQKQEALKDTLHRLDIELGLGAIVDVVLNHISAGSHVLEEHPEYAYNLDNSPYLRVAYELDKGLEEFSKNLANRRVTGYTSGSQIKTEQDLTMIMRILKAEVLPRLRLNEFFLADEGAALQHFQEAPAEEVSQEVRKSTLEKGLEKTVLKYLVVGEGETRLGVRLDSGRVKTILQLLQVPEAKWQGEARALLKKLNSANQTRYEGDLLDILKNIEGDIRYHKLERRDYTISDSNPLVKPYFTHLKNGTVAAFNGFIMDNRNVLEDFAGRGTLHYFKRNIVAWSDCVKLRYGSRREDAEGLWARMEEYITHMAQAFKGIRLDNAHGTPLHLSSHMLEVARAVNPELLVIAELFTSDAKLDSMFVERLGINALIREAMNAWDTRQLSSLVYAYGNGESQSLGSLEETDVINESLVSLAPEELKLKFKATPLPGLFYDCTHDNETPAHKRTAADALPGAAIVAFTNTAAASTRGYDELIPEQLSVVTERRLYKSAEDRPQVPKVRVSAGDESVEMTIYYEDPTQRLRTVEVKGNWDSWSQSINLA
jgi:glycogen debranching enzyme